MDKSSKIVLTIVIVIVAFILFSVIVGVRTDSGHKTPGIFALILLAATYGSLRALWKKDKGGKDNNNSSILQP